MLVSGMGQAEFIAWSDEGLEDLKSQLDSNAKLIKISLHGRKGDKNQYNYSTFIGGDALTALKRYVGERGLRPGAIFVNTHGEALTKKALTMYWGRKLERLGLAVAGNGWSGKHPHELRDTFRTLWRRSGVPVEYGEYFIRHREAFDKYGYDKTAQDDDELRKRYLEALPFLNILSENKPFKLVREDEVTQLRRENEEIRRQLEEAKAGQNNEIAKMKTTIAHQAEINKALAEEIQAIKKLLQSKEQTH